MFPGGERRLVFDDPMEIVAPEGARELGSAFARLEEALDAGYAIAGYVTYECGAAFLGIDVPRVAETPLLAIGIFAPPNPGSAANRNRNRDGDGDGGCERASMTSERRAAYAMPVALIARDAYERGLAEIARSLLGGDVYQVNLTVPFAFAFGDDPSALFASLLARAAVPHPAFVEHDDRAYLSLSPELFLHFGTGREIVTKPMKGTSRPGAIVDLASAKNRAEHVMIVDLLRNDLHRICDEVRVERLFERERYPTFATMTSTIRGTLRERATLYEIFEATFPCGSITGAPKQSAMRTIAELECAPRGIAMGSIGYLLPERTGTWNVAIRTIALDTTTKRAEVRIGGGIVADSEASTEWAEILIKRRLFSDEAEPVAIFETLRAGTTDEERTLHIDRMCDSAERLGIPIVRSEIARTIARACAEAYAETSSNASTVVRVELSAAATFSVSRRLLDAHDVPARVCLSPVTLDSADPLLRHKTTRRSAYDAASAYARERGCFEALLRNDRGEVADGARTTLFLRDRDGTLATPPLTDGALNGILRARLLAASAAVERTIDVGELIGSDLYIGNAARGLLPATFVVDGI